METMMKKFKMKTSLKGFYWPKIGLYLGVTRNGLYFRPIVRIFGNVYLYKFYKTNELYFTEESLTFLNEFYDIRVKDVDMSNISITSSWRLNDLTYTKLSKMYKSIREVKLHFMSIECYSRIDKSYIGDPEDTLKAHLKGFTQIQNYDNVPDSKSNIAFSEHESKWYAWSNNYMMSFGIGNKLFESDFIDENIPLSECGNYIIENMFQSKEAAKNLAKYLEKLGE